MKNVLIIFLIIFCIGCIPRKKLMYLQNSQDFELTMDSMVKKEPEALEYKLQPGDILSIQIRSITPEKYSFESLQNEDHNDPILSGFLIDEMGVIDIPYVGSLSIGGMTINNARKFIIERAEDKLINPNVNVKLLNYSYTILGEVNRPGTFTTYKDRLTFFEALGNAGDLTDFAERSYVKVIRKIDDDQLKLNYLNLLDEDFINSEYYYIRPGDVIYVAPLKVKNVKQFQIPNIALGASILTVISLFLIRIN